jgi:hypothetical protein
MAVCAVEGFFFPLTVEIAGLTESEGRDARNRLVDASLLRMLNRDRHRFQLHAGRATEPCAAWGTPGGSCRGHAEAVLSALAWPQCAIAVNDDNSSGVDLLSVRDVVARTESINTRTAANAEQFLS